MVPGPALEQLEREISAVLNNMTDIRREGSELIIEGDGKTEKFVAEKKKKNNSIFNKD